MAFRYVENKDESFSKWHYAISEPLYACDIDFLLYRKIYDKATRTYHPKVVAVLEVKLMGNKLDGWQLEIVTNEAKLHDVPAFFLQYTRNCHLDPYNGNFTVTPLNDKASVYIPETKTITNNEWLNIERELRGYNRK